MSVHNTIKMDMDTCTSSTHQEETKQEDGILIEKDGIFQLMSMSDMQADRDQVPAEGGGAGTEQQKDTSSENVNTESTNKEISPSMEDLKQPEIDSKMDVKCESTIKFEESQSPPQNTTNTQTTTSDSKHKPLTIRTKSAPEFRLEAQSKEDDSLKRERNEAAFRAWLTKKNRELIEQKQNQLSKTKLSEEELTEKQKRNEVAYQAWLECKKQEYLEQRAKGNSIRPVTSIKKDEEGRRRAAFENWLSRKQEEKQKEIDNQQRIRQQEEVAARKADPTIVTEAYKRYVQCCYVITDYCLLVLCTYSWLHRKRVQARDEALRKELYRKKYYRQSRLLKRSTTQR